jgi:hypothetical protein
MTRKAYEIFVERYKIESEIREIDENARKAKQSLYQRLSDLRQACPHPIVTEKDPNDPLSFLECEVCGAELDK